MEQTPRVSIIVPVYNVAPYLRQCMDSLINQTYRNIEIICVNDGATDESGAILAEYAAKDSTIKVISQKNAGLSAARNVGFSFATGDYVMYVDSDDWIDLETCETAVAIAVKHKADIVFWPYIRESQNAQRPKTLFYDDYIVFDEEEFFTQVYETIVGLHGAFLKHPENADTLVTAWGKLYRRALLIKNNAEFVDTKEIGTEDALFNMQALKSVRRGVYIRRYFSHYRKNNTTSLTSTYKPKLSAQWNHLFECMYNTVVLAGGKTAKSILISCGARLAPFDIKELRDLMSYDELELDTLGDRKTALFLIMSDTDSTFNFVIAMLQSQLFNLLCDKADDEYGGKLPVHVRCLLDEFANIGQIPQFEKLIATIRSREISASIILQSQSQLKAIYKDAAEIILDNADSTLFLGGRGKNAKDISENLGRETIDSFNTSENRGTQVSHGLNYQKLGKELMTQDEIAVMDGGKCILQLRGVRPFFSDKYDITQHPNYKYLSDFDKKNAFDVERYMSTRPAIVKPDEPFDIYEIDLSDEDAAAE